MPPISLLIKPSSSACNLQCEYCFYADVSSKREVKHFGFMSEETMKQLIKKAFEYSTHQITFAFQGGEPTLIGLPFYQSFVEEVNRYRANSAISIQYALQTNGTLITEEMAIFFAKEKFLLGVSLDGPKEIHDQNRKNFKHQGSYSQVQKGITLLKKHQVEFNILSVVSKVVAKHPQKIYSFFKKEGFSYLQFIPCLDNFDEPHGVTPYALTPELYGNFLTTLFELWYQDLRQGNHVSIRMFDNLYQMIQGYPPESCDMRGQCSANLVIEADGSVYPCDFYVLDQWKLGNVQHHDFETLINSHQVKEFVDVSLKIDEKCKGCSYFGLCRGGCRRHRSNNSQSELELNYFCASYQQFYQRFYACFSGNR